MAICDHLFFFPSHPFCKNRARQNQKECLHSPLSSQILYRQVNCPSIVSQHFFTPFRLIKFIKVDHSILYISLLSYSFKLGKKQVIIYRFSLNYIRQKNLNLCWALRKTERLFFLCDLYNSSKLNIFIYTEIKLK